MLIIDFITLLACAVNLVAAQAETFSFTYNDVLVWATLSEPIALSSSIVKTPSATPVQTPIGQLSEMLSSAFSFPQTSAQKTPFLTTALEGPFFSSTPTLLTALSSQTTVSPPWDDEPTYSPQDESNAPYPPVFNPYHDLFFSNGYAYAPPPSDPFPPISSPHLAIFLPNASTQGIGFPGNDGEQPGELGAGPRASLDAFWFNAYGAYLGCDNSGPHACQMQVKGFAWDQTSNSEVLATQYSFNLAPCPGFVNCHLAPVEFPDDFKNLSGLQILASVNGVTQVFFMDNLRMGWVNNTCTAATERMQSNRLRTRHIPRIMSRFVRTLNSRSLVPRYIRTYEKH